MIMRSAVLPGLARLVLAVLWLAGTATLFLVVDLYT
jgi:hypothetical protein